MTELVTTYTVTGSNFAGVMTFKFHLGGYLVAFSLEEAELDQDQRKWLYPRMPLAENGMKTFYDLKTFKVEKGEPDLSFENFWNAYGKKQKRTVAEKLWKKLTKKDKLAAFKSINRYNNWLNNNAGIAKQLPDTFIRQRRWLDDFNN